ncbi:MAG: TRAM domain-containing protein, partial [Bacteroidota bacterium]
MKKGDTVTLRLEKFADRGKSLARLDGYVVFVAGAVPGDLVEARIFKRRKSFAEGRLTKVLEPSTLRTDPVCQYFAACGGCKWQHVEYGAQLDAKQQSVHEALMHAGGFEGVEVLPTIAADPIYRYRNKMEFSFSAFRWLTDWEIASGAELDKSFAAGLHVPGRFDKVLDLTACFLMPEVGVRVLNATRAFAKQHGWTPWNVRTHEGYLRNLMLRMPVFEDELMVALTTSADMPERAEQLAEHYQATIPEITTFVNVINPTIGQTPYGAQTNVLFGPGVVHDRIGPHRFEIGPSAFFQTNSRQAEVLYDVAREYAQLKPT